MRRRVDVVLVRPAGYAHTEVFREVALSLVCALRRLGLASDAAENDFAPGRQVIILGGHLLSEKQLARIPPDATIYNLEQLDDDVLARFPLYGPALASRRVWDYSKRNLTRLSTMIPGVEGTYVPIGYVPELTKAPLPKEGELDIDVLFYGSMSPRRRAILDGLSAAGLKVHSAFSVYGDARDELIARAKLVLSVHNHPARIFEVVRVSYLLANRKAVVAECGPDTEIEDDLRPAVACSEYDHIVETCRALLLDDPRREALAERGFRVFSARRLEDILRGALAPPGNEPRRERRAAASLDQLARTYEASFAGQPRRACDPAALASLRDDAVALVNGHGATSGHRQPDEGTARVCLANLEDELASVREAHEIGESYDRFARLASRANVALCAYARHFAAHPRRSRDVSFLDELTSELATCRESMEHLASAYPGASFASDLAVVTDALAAFRAESEAIAQLQRDPALARAPTKDLLAELANEQFALYTSLFAGKSRVTRRPALLARIIGSLRRIEDRMRALDDAASPRKDNDLDVVIRHRALYETELARVRAERKPLPLEAIAARLGEEANRTFERFDQSFARRGALDVDLALLGTLSDELRELAGQMLDLSLALAHEGNERNIDVVLDRLLLFESQHAKVVRARAGGAR